MIIELPGFEFEKPYPNTLAIEPLFDKVRQFLDKKGINRNEYTLVTNLWPGLAN